MSKISIVGEAAPALRSTAQAAKYLNLSPDQLLDLVAAGLIPAANVGLGRKRPTYRFRMADLDAFLVSRMTTSS